MDDKIKLESIFDAKKEAQEHLVMDSGTSSEYAKKLDGQMKRYDALVQMAHRNEMVLLEALEQAQTKYKKYDRRYSKPWKRRFKNLLISWGWYQPSKEELEDISRGV